MTPWQVGVVLVTALITGFIGNLIGKRAGRGNAGFWLGFLLSVIGIAIIALVPSDASEEAKIRKEADRLRIQQEAQRRLDAEGAGQQ
jgi:hypothetical protein